MSRDSSPAVAVLAAFGLVATCLLGACASDTFHYSQVVGDRFFKTNIDTYPVEIASVDGRHFLGRMPVLVDPGVRQIAVQGPPTFVDLRLTRDIALDVKPCTRYYLVARKASRLDNDFEVRVDFEQPIAGCTPPSK
jgi:hypothetical protein